MRRLSLYPFPFAERGHDLAWVSRTVVPIFELLARYPQLEHQHRDVADGESVTVRVDHDDAGQ